MGYRTGCGDKKKYSQNYRDDKGFGRELIVGGTIHIANGDAAAGRLKQWDPKLTCISWREALIEGPALKSGLNDWIKARAEYLSEAYGIEPGRCRKDLESLHASLRGTFEADEVVLWFDEDAFCQVNLMYLLSVLAGALKTGTRVTIPKSEGNSSVHAISNLSETKLQAAFDKRQEYAPDKLGIAKSAWSAYCAKDPLAIRNFAFENEGLEPSLKTAMLSHLRRFPAKGDGLGVTERFLLKTCASAPLDFEELFARFSTTMPLYGFGDYQVWNLLVRLSGAVKPLLDAKRLSPPTTMNQAEMLKTRFAITMQGQKVLAGEVDFLTCLPAPTWLGGALINTYFRPRWDDDRQQFVL